MGSLIQKKKSILLNEPHLGTASGGIANFKTDMVGKLKSCSIEFVPHQSGKGDPSSTNVRPIIGRTGIDIYRCGKNLCSPFTIGIGIDGTTGAEMVSNTRASTDFIPISFASNENYIWSGIVNNLNSMACAYNANKEYLGRTSAISRTSLSMTKDAFTSGTPQATGDIAFLRLSYFQGSGQNINNIASAKHVLNKGTTAEEYEPYTGQVFPVTWQSTGTVYGGVVDAITGELIQTHKYVSLGSFTWSLYSNNTSRQLFRSASISDMKPAESNSVPFDGLSTEFKIVAFNTTLIPKVLALYAGTLFAGAQPSQYADATAFKTAMASVMLVYALNAPQTVGMISPTTIKTLAGVNNVSSNANGNVSVEYWKH